MQREFPGIHGFSAQNLWYTRQLFLEYSGKPKLQPLVGEISWTKNLVIMSSCKDDLEREFYIRMTKKFGWSKNVLIHHIENQSYEKTLPGVNSPLLCDRSYSLMNKGLRESENGIRGREEMKPKKE